MDPVQELEQSYPGVRFEDLSQVYNCRSGLFQRVHRQPTIFRYRVKVWGRKFEQDGKVNKRSTKKAVAVMALNHLKECVTTIDSCEADEIERKVEEKYNEVSATRENAAAMRKVLAAIVVKKKVSGDTSMNVVALGTGTKCISSRNMIPGMTVNDCHGEVIVKRAFQRYLYQQLSLCFENHKNDSIFQLAPLSGKYIVKPGISFHMYVSTAPCGDARVFMPVGLGVQPDGHTGRTKRGKSRCKIDEGEGSVLAERHQNDDRMVIMSCSDKMASWNVTGVQGSLLSLFVNPIFFKSIVVGKNYNYEHMARGVFVRVEAVQKNEAFPESYKASAPLVGKANTSIYKQAKQSSSYSLNWWEGVMLEVIDTSIGCTQGGSPSRLCKHEMFMKWLCLFKYPLSPNITENGIPITKLQFTSNDSYAFIKSLANEYQSVKQMLHKHYSDYLGPWIQTQGQNDFTINQ